jgi:hypothetical protein
LRRFYKARPKISPHPSLSKRGNPSFFVNGSTSSPS